MGQGREQRGKSSTNIMIKRKFEIISADGFLPNLVIVVRSCASAIYKIKIVATINVSVTKNYLIHLSQTKVFCSHVRGSPILSLRVINGRHFSILLFDWPYWPRFQT